jgi:hypothetical protein
MVAAPACAAARYGSSTARRSATLATSQYNRTRGPLVSGRANKNVMFAVERGYDAEAQVMYNCTERQREAVLAKRKPYAREPVAASRCEVPNRRLRSIVGDRNCTGGAGKSLLIICCGRP